MVSVARAHKVLMLVHSESVPDDSRLWPEAVALRDRGFQVSIISPKGNTRDRESHVCLEGIHIYRYHMPDSGNTYSAYVREYCVALLMRNRITTVASFPPIFGGRRCADTWRVKGGKGHGA